MSKADISAAILWVGATLYAVFGGADFGAGFWSLVGGRGERAERARRLVDSAIGPVWEANHVWLIFILVVLWTAFSVAFEAVMSTLFIPLCLAALGIVLRGSGFAFHEVVKRPRERSFAEHLFAASSVITPFFMGTVVGAIASGRVPVGNAAGDPWSSWLNPVSILIGVLFVATGAYLAAVFLITDARHAGDEDLERYFAARALVAALVTGAIAVAGIFVLRDDARYVYDGLTSDALPLVIASGLCGIGALVAIRRGAQARRAPARGRRRGRGDLGLGRRPVSLPAADLAHDLRWRWHRADADHGDRRLRGRRVARAAGHRPALHAHPTQHPPARRRTRATADKLILPPG